MLRTLEFRPEADEQFFEQLPASAAVFALRGEPAGSEAYISKTANLRRRARRLLASPVKPPAASPASAPTDAGTSALSKPDAALRRLDEGTYGHCEACGEPLEEQRLAALPAARFCAQHQNVVEGLI